MSRKQLAAVMAALSLAIVTVVFLLVTGGADSESVPDAAGDVTVGEGSKPPTDLDLVDASEVKVRKEGTQVIFEATMAELVPQEFEEASLDFRWDIFEGGAATWIVTANVDVGAQASVISQRTDYGASTVDDTLPGSIELDGTHVIIRLERNDIPEWPSSFQWSFKATLDADLRDGTSALAEDRVPDDGTRGLE